MADRVLVMTPRPGRIVREVKVDLPRPRTLDMQATPYFTELTNDIKTLINSSVRK